MIAYARLYSTPQPVVASTDDKLSRQDRTPSMSHSLVPLAQCVKSSWIISNIQCNDTARLAPQQNVSTHVCQIIVKQSSSITAHPAATNYAKAWCVEGSKQGVSTDQATIQSKMIESKPFFGTTRAPNIPRLAVAIWSMQHANVKV